MKIVHSPDMVAHLWANRSQDTARTSGQNFYFTGPVLYSYGSHFVIGAHLDNGRILWNDATYGNTTSRHQTHAWRALNRQQNENRLHVPSLDHDKYRDLERLRESGQGRTLPRLAQSCLDGIVDAVESMAKMRLGCGRIKSAFSRAKGLEKSADALREYVAKGKRMPAWPLPRLPESLPTDKPGLLEFIRSIAKGRLMQCHDGAIATARQNLQHIIRAMESPDGWQIQNIPGTIATINRGMTDAQRWHETAKGKKSAAVRAVLKDLSSIEPAAMAMVNDWKAKQARAEIRSVSRDIFSMLRKRGTRGIRNHSTPSGYRGRRDSGYYLGKLTQALQALPPEESAQHAALLARIERCNAWDVSMNGMESARDNVKTGLSYLPGHPGDAMRQFIQASNYAIEAARKHAGFAALHGVECLTIAKGAQDHVETLRAEIAAKHARAVDDWKAGLISSLSYEAGTYARIKGETVQTSRGAVVPIAHACRLARIARRVIAAGGKTWPDGTGPMIGSFRVNSIGADGAAVIGCHQFDAAESMRVLALLESCEHCATVSTTADDGEMVAA
jgi:hypothetical protein